MRGISWLAANPLASQEELCNMEWVSKYYNIMGPPSYMRSVVDRHFVMRRMTALLCGLIFFALWWYGDYNTSNYNIMIIYDLSLWKKKLDYKQEFGSQLYVKLGLTLSLLTWRIWCAPNNANRWQMGFNLAFKELIWTFAMKVFRSLLTAVEEGWVLTVSNLLFCKYLYGGRLK